MLALLAAAGGASAQTPLGSLQRDITHELALAGEADGAFVYDLTAKKTIFSERALTARPPASVEKLYTATAALQEMGPTARLQTTVEGVGRLEAGGTWAGNLYLRGGGDPTFGSSNFIATGTSVSTLVSQLVRKDGIHHITGSVIGDESFFDSRRGEPSSGYAFDPWLEGTLSALAFNRGESGHERGAHAPAAYAARELWRGLKNDGVSISGGVSAANTPAGATVLADAPSPTIAELIIVDGSGLSRADRTSPYQVVQLLAGVYPTPLGVLLRERLAVAGRSGTLELRMRHTRAEGNCRGKTGTLEGASNLVGYCRAADGHELAFAIFTDGIATEAAHTFQDHIAISLANSRLSEAELAQAKPAGSLLEPLTPFG
jgi:D-alanyl-D-alanine carboxypeptidase/D-alanyl-D-alanine-endopeptidase (penicillin-binding protein 4)